ncbi:MAG: hypothetical protein BAJALOKI2v1_70088 [Promethearchaeota archaeon]|nr:MAG: hypothetical protein BAJALOKI2v1_70088 [Candidatus Lokiarchaeota archaeon]
MKCPECGYNLVKPYPEDYLCPRCEKFLPNVFRYFKDHESSTRPKEFTSKELDLKSKFKGKVRVKKKSKIVSFNEDRIQFKNGEYIKLMGVTSVDRTPLYHTNDRYVYLLELTNNLDFISTSILGGELDKMLLISQDTMQEEKCQFYQRGDIIYLVYGIFPDKKGKWILEQMANHYSQLVQGKDVNNLEKIEKYQIDSKFKGMINFILKEYTGLQEVFSDKDLPYVEDKLELDYIGLSSKSIGVISLLLEEESLELDLPGEFDDPDEEREMKESQLTAKIEALAANTLGNTGAFPRWIAVKESFQSYRFITFQQYPNDYYLNLLVKGNLGKVSKIEKELNPLINHVTDDPFAGNLRPFNRLRRTLKNKYEDNRTFT